MASEAVIEGVSGAAGGMVALLATYPLMTISTMQATRRHVPSQAQGSGDGQPPLLKAKRPAAIADIIEAVKSVGMSGLFSGLQPALLGTAVSQGVYFYFYSLLRDLAVSRKHAAAGTTAVRESREEELPIGSSLLVAALAGAANVLLTNPIWVVATRMQSNRNTKLVPPDQPQKSGPLSVARDIYRESGPPGFWNGALPALVMVCNPTVQYVLFEWLLARVRDARLKAGRKTGPTGGQVFLIGALAKTGATLVTYPLLLVKNRLMSASHDYTGTVDALTSIWKQDGIRGFYRGLRAKIVQSVLAAAILFYIREQVYAAVRATLGSPRVIRPPKAVA